MADKINKSTYVIGFYKGHNATACLLKDGEIVAAASEERFNRIKNTDTFPTLAIKYCLSKEGLKPQDVNLFVRTYKHPEGYVTQTGKTEMPLLIRLLTTPKVLLRKISYVIPKMDDFLRFMWNVLSIYILTPYYQKQFSDSMSKFLKVDKSKIAFADHHLCHAYAAFYGFVPATEQKEDHLVITLDGEGDGICGTVSLVKNGSWRRLSSMQGGNSIATFYGLITEFLGMKINEHEYKVMGLAPYSSNHEINKVYPLFEGLFSVNSNLQLVSKIPSGSYMSLFDQVLIHQRFDGIAGAAQKYVEDIVSELIVKAVKKTGVRNVVLSGGFFMNVKANKRIGELPEIKKLTVCPSAADESVVFGATYWAYQKLQNNKAIKNIPNLYLGPNFTDEEIEKDIKLNNNKYQVKKYSDIEKEVAKLLAKGKIVARFKGRMEWGARALGNRSILMHPSNKEGVRLLNEQIKSRDFWMPFAATILDEFEGIYLRNPKRIKGNFMILAYDVTEKGKTDLAAAIHPYDSSCRPQVLTADQNPDYYKLVSYFKDLTGIGAILNTSFNYHGEPIVCTPSDALHTFDVTGLEYLALGNYLVWKK